MSQLLTTSFEDSTDVSIAEASFKKIVKNKLYMEFEP